MVFVLALPYFLEKRFTESYYWDVLINEFDDEEAEWGVKSNALDEFVFWIELFLYWSCWFLSLFAIGVLKGDMADCY